MFSTVPTVLVIDDEHEILNILKEELQEKGHKVELAQNGDEAIEKLNTDQCYDLVLSDFRMEPGDGLKVLEQVNRFSADDRPAFVFMTGYADISEQEAYEKGAESFFAKPFDVDELVETIEKILKEKKNK